MRNLVCMLLFALVVSRSALAQQRPRVTHLRRHFELNDKAGQPYYEATVAHDFSDERQNTRILLRDHRFGDFVLSRVLAFPDGESTTTIGITDAEGKSYVRINFIWAIKAKSVSEYLSQAHEHPQLLQAPTIVTLETNGGKWEAVETEWRGTDRRRQLRTEVRQSMNPRLLEAIERMRGMAMATTEFTGFVELVTDYILHGTAGEAQQGLIENTLQPDCDFDKSFGIPCTEKQLARIKKADEEHRPITDY
jgi:hypothetical protein